MLITIYCITVVLISIVFVGIPFTWLLHGCRWQGERAWLQAPFLGIAAIVLILQSLVYLDLPIRYTAPLIWAAGLAGWAWLYRRKELPAIFAAAPRMLFGIALAVYLLQGLGLLIVGARFYSGKAWGDQYNYTALAQFLVDERFSTTMADIGNRPYLVTAIFFKLDRIGQSVLHGFFTASSLQSAKSLFEPTILLSTPLLVLAIYGLSCRSGMQKHYALATGAVAGLLPAVTLVHLESFLSQALAISLLLLFPLLLDDVIKHIDWRHLSVCAVMAATVVSIYTEFWLILLGLTTLMFGIAALGAARPWRLLVCWAVVMVAPFVLNPHSAELMSRFFRRMDMTLLESLYPWALSIEGIGRVWLGDLAAASYEPQLPIRGYTFILTGLGYYGLMHMAISSLSANPANAPAYEQRRVQAFALGLLSLALLPFVVLAQDSQHTYQFYKLLLSTSPLLVLGVGLVFQSYLPAAAGLSLAFLPRRIVLLRHLPALLATSVMLVTSIVATTLMVIQSTSLQPAERNNSPMLLTPGMRQLQEQLESLQGSKLFYYEPGTSWNTAFLNAWLAYFARDNQLWMGNPRLNGLNLATIPEVQLVVDLKTVPADVLILSRIEQPTITVSTTQKLLWSNDSYQLWKPDSSPWLVPFRFENPNGFATVDGLPFFWMGGGDTTLDILTSKSSVLHLVATFLPGPSLPGQVERTLLVETNAGYRSQLTLMPGDRSIPLPVVAGYTRVTLRPLDQPTIKKLPNGDARPMLLGVQGIRAVLDDDLAILAQIQTPVGYGIRQLNGAPFFWMGQAPVKLPVYAIQAGTLTLQTYIMPGPSLPETKVRRVLVESDTGYREEVTLAAGKQEITLPVQAGMTTIILTALDTSTVAKLSNGDSRILLLGVHALAVRLDP
jgi:hypothetical protein